MKSGKTENWNENATHTQYTYTHRRAFECDERNARHEERVGEKKTAARCGKYALEKWLCGSA